MATKSFLDLSCWSAMANAEQLTIAAALILIEGLRAEMIRPHKPVRTMLGMKLGGVLGVEDRFLQSSIRRWRGVLPPCHIE
jgi:hypothetical protein